MAAESVIPQSYPSLTTGQAPASINEMLATDLDQDELLRDLLNDNDLLSSLLSSDQPTGVPLTSSDLFTTGLSTNFDSTDLSLQQSLLNDPFSQHAFNDHSLQHTHANPSLQLSSPVGSEECVSDFSIEQSPSWSTNSSDGFLLPNMAAQPQLDQQQLGQIGGNLESDLQMSGITDQQRSTSSPSSSGGDVHIDLGDVSAMVGSSDRLGIVSSSSERKMGGSTITKEEEKMLAEEGIYLPADMPLTKAEEKHLKRVRRKIKNKISAAESRKRKKDYVEGLEERVEKCTKINRSLQERVINLEKHNRSLLTQLKRLQEYVSQCSPTKVRAGSCIMVLLLSFSLLMVHNLQLTTSQDNAGVVLRSYSSRALLKVEADDFGNLVDPETRQVISAAGSKSPILPPPWKCQTPSFDFWNTRQKG